MQLKSIILSLSGLISVVTADGPINLTFGQQAAAVELDQQDVRVYFQDNRTAIVEISPHFPAGTGWDGPTTIVPPGIARNSTAIAAVLLKESQGTTFGEIHVYYFGNSFSQTQLREKVWTAGSGWADGSLNTFAVPTFPQSQFLYAFTDGDLVGATIRVGYASRKGIMSEAYWTPSTGWVTNYVT